jgi:hypothetical protein
MTLTLRGARGVLILAIIGITGAVTPDEANAACVAENDALATCLEAARRRLAEATNCETLEGFDCPEDIPKDVCRFICAQDAERTGGPERSPPDVDWEEEAEWHTDHSAASADDDDAAVFCSFAVETLASQCAAPSDCPAENRARLSCYYRALCEDQTLGCEPLAADDPSPTALATTAPAPRPTSGASPSPTVAPTAPESDDAATVRLGGVCAATVWLIVVAVATWLLIA